MGERDKGKQNHEQSVRIRVPPLGTTDEALAGSTVRPNQQYRDPPSGGRTTLDDTRRGNGCGQAGRDEASLQRYYYATRPPPLGQAAAAVGLDVLLLPLSKSW